MARICVYPGSFDPVTVGHLDVIRRAAALFDEVIVTVMHNVNKRGCFPVDERMALIARAVREIPNVRVDKWDGLLVDYVRMNGACAVVRGLRAVSDFDTEMTMAQVNSQLLPGMETLFLMARPEHACISSSVVREAAAFGADISAFVPAQVAEEIRAHFRH
ncbi:MAG: pantetheine-phosphate adenylyltransferase [Aristaeellaceae bacterium]